MCCFGLAGRLCKGLRLDQVLLLPVEVGIGEFFAHFIRRGHEALVKPIDEIGALFAAGEAEPESRLWGHEIPMEARALGEDAGTLTCCHAVSPKTQTRSD